MALGLRKLVKTLHFVAARTGHLDRLVSNTGSTLRISRSTEGSSTQLDHGVTQDVQLPLGKGTLHANFLARLAFDPDIIDQQ